MQTQICTVYLHRRRVLSTLEGMLLQLRWKPYSGDKWWEKLLFITCSAGTCAIQPASGYISSRPSLPQTWKSSHFPRGGRSNSRKQDLERGRDIHHWRVQGRRERGWRRGSLGRISLKEWDHGSRDRKSVSAYECSRRMIRCVIWGWVIQGRNGEWVGPVEKICWAETQEGWKEWSVNRNYSFHRWLF